MLENSASLSPLCSACSLLRYLGAYIVATEQRLVLVFCKCSGCMGGDLIFVMQLSYHVATQFFKGHANLYVSYDGEA